MIKSATDLRRLSRSSVKLTRKLSRGWNNDRVTSHSDFIRYSHERDQLSEWKRPDPVFPEVFRDRTSNETIYRARVVPWRGEQRKIQRGTTCILCLAFLLWHLVAPPHAALSLTVRERSRPGVGAEEAHPSMLIRDPDRRSTRWRCSLKPCAAARC